MHVIFPVDAPRVEAEELRDEPHDDEDDSSLPRAARCSRRASIRARPRRSARR